MRTVLFLLALASYAIAETCPPKENVYPCNCGKKNDGGILVECKNPTMTLEKLKDVISNLSDKKKIDLILFNTDRQSYDRNISIPNNLFDGIDMKKLEIYNYNLEGSGMSYDQQILVGLENTLEELVLFESVWDGYYDKPVKLHFGHLKRLKELELSMNMMPELSNDLFDEGPASLEYLKISHNGVQKVRSRVFASLSNLKRLFFSGSHHFGSLKRSMFPNPADRLGFLMLDENGLTSLPEDLFTNMPALKIISLRGNGIFSLDQRTWQPVWRQLAVIHLENVPIICDAHLKWIYSLRRTSAIYGTCVGPKDMEGLTLQEFIDKQGQSM